jgi:murein DD-endopeptidase MepM/ murein hydrolase activator NlpD
VALSFALFTAPFASAQRVEISWPTPNRAWEQGKSYEAWAQPTVSGETESGLFGCVRSGGTQFHEGIDIHAVSRDARGEPADKVTAAMDGVVRYANSSPGNSNYGRYIVLEHPDAVPAVYTLYAHLARIEPGIAPGELVRRGQVIALMGRSEGSTAIPKDRAHLHFEIGLMMTRDFASWYQWKRFGGVNEHGLWNGMNLMGFDPNEFLGEWRRHKVDNFQQYLDGMRSVVRVRVATNRVPDFITRYPALLRRPMPAGLVGGWEIECNSTGIPFAWTPLRPTDVMGLRPDTAQIVWADATLLRAYRCKSIAKQHGSGWVPGSDLATMLQQVFGLR